jgi:hypothetical protein
MRGGATIQHGARNGHSVKSDKSGDANPGTPEIREKSGDALLKSENPGTPYSKIRGRKSENPGTPYSFLDAQRRVQFPSQVDLRFQIGL